MTDEVVYDRDETETMIENAVGQLYRGIYRMDKSGGLLEAYDTLGFVLDLIMKTREDIRNRIKNS